MHSVGKGVEGWAWISVLLLHSIVNLQAEIFVSSVRNVQRVIGSNLFVCIKIVSIRYVCRRYYIYTKVYDKIRDKTNSKSRDDSSSRGFSWFFRTKLLSGAFHLFFDLSIFASLFTFSLSRSLSDSQSRRFEEPIQWVTSFAHFISVNGGVTLAHLLHLYSMQCSLAPFCKHSSISNSLSFSLPLTYQHARRYCWRKQWFFAAFFKDADGDGGGGGGGSSDNDKQQTMGKKICDKRKH